MMNIPKLRVKKPVKYPIILLLVITVISLSIIYITIQIPKQTVLSDETLGSSHDTITGPCNSEKNCYVAVEQAIPHLQEIVDLIVNSNFVETPGEFNILKQNDGTHEFNNLSGEGGYVYDGGSEPRFRTSALQKLQSKGWFKWLEDKSYDNGYTGIAKYGNDISFADVLIKGKASQKEMGRSTHGLEPCYGDIMLFVSYFLKIDSRSKDMIRISNTNWYYSIGIVETGGACPQS